MNKLTALLLVFILLTTINSCIAQNSEVYEIAFSLDKKLLVFKGKLNGIETEFAFDTGAAEGIATTKQEENKGIERKKNTQKIADANGQTSAFTSVITKELSIGGYTFSNVRATVGEMQYFYCMNLYLLGADIIRKLNWEIDFKRMVLKVSKSRFTTDNSMAVMPVNYKYNRPLVALKINDNSYDDVLIDIGYTGVMTLPNTDKQINTLLATKKQQQLVTSKMSSSFTALGLSKPMPTETAVIDSVYINGTYYQKIPAEISTNTDFKLGLNFFNATSEKVIINNTDKKYYLVLKPTTNFNQSFPVAVLLKGGKLIVSSVTVYNNSVDNIFTINEEIKAINGKTATDFTSECDYLTWYYTTKWNNHKIEKVGGQIFTIERSPNR